MGLEKIAEYKKKMGLTTDELSQKSGVPIGTLNKILSGATKDPKLETLKSIAKVLGLSLNDFDDLTEIDAGTIAAHKDDELFTDEELQKIEEYKKLLLAARSSYKKGDD